MTRLYLHCPIRAHLTRLQTVTLFCKGTLDRTTVTLFYKGTLDKATVTLFYKGTLVKATNSYTVP